MKLWRSKKCATCIYMGQVEEARYIIKYREGNTEGEKDGDEVCDEGYCNKAIVIRPVNLISCMMSDI